MFYETKVQYQKQTGEDSPANVRESYLVQCVNCSEAESRTIEYIKPNIFGECETPQIKKRQFFEIVEELNLFDPYNDNYYEGKVELITIEDSGKESRKKVDVLVLGRDLMSAVHSLCRAMNGYDCEIIAIKKSAICEILRNIDNK